MYKWKPKNKKAEKKWNLLLKEHENSPQEEKDSSLFLYEQYCHQNTFNDDRKIVYMTDGFYITKDGIVLDEKDAYLLDI